MNEPEKLHTDADCITAIELALYRLKKAKPDDRSEKARRYAVTITELEKVYAYFDTFVMKEANP